MVAPTGLVVTLNVSVSVSPLRSVALSVMAAVPVTPEA